MYEFDGRKDKKGRLLCRPENASNKLDLLWKLTLKLSNKH